MGQLKYLHLNMYRYFLFGLLFVLLGIATIYLTKTRQNYATDQATIRAGKALFSKYCSSCHGLQEDGFGPPLGGITAVFSQQDLVNFISNPSEAIAAGDQRSIVLQRRYRQVMPAFNWMDSKDMLSILAFIDRESAIHQIAPLVVSQEVSDISLSGRLVDPVARSELAVELAEIVKIPQLEGSSPDLGIVTLRAHPLANGILYAGDQDGIIYRIEGNSANVFLDLRDEIPDFQSGPGIATGLGSFDFHPDYLNNGLLYILYAETYHGQKADHSVTDTVQSAAQWILSEWKVNDVSARQFEGSHRELLRLHAPTFGHGAQDLQFNHGLAQDDPDYGLLYFGYGDGGCNNIGRPDMCHRLTSFLGTIMRIDPLGSNSNNGKYGIPSDNPFVNEKDPATVKEIYAFGFRNPHRFTWDVSDIHLMIATDIGESNIEEINFIEKGGDYGWPRREGNYGILTTKDKKTVYPISDSDLQLYKKPFAQYDHEDGHAVSGGFVYDGDILALKNKYIFGDIVTGNLFYLDLSNEAADSTIHQLGIIENDRPTSLSEMSGATRMHLRISYDRYKKEMYIITKCDGTIRKIVQAYER
jgi:hypothetical protein